jgi:hypothetical protein
MASDVAVTYNFTNTTNADAEQVDTNYADLVTWINTNAVHLDASKAFTGVPSGPATDPSTANQLSRKSYVDAGDAATLAAAAKGYVGSTSFTALQGTSGAAGTVEMASATVTLSASRRYKISFTCFSVINYSPGDTQLQISRGGTPIQLHRVDASGTGAFGGQSFFVIDTGYSGSIEYTVELYTSAVSGAGIDATASWPAILLVEDIGD